LRFLQIVGRCNMLLEEISKPPIICPICDRTMHLSIDDTTRCNMCPAGHYYVFMDFYSQVHQFFYGSVIVNFQMRHTDPPHLILNKLLHIKDWILKIKSNFGAHNWRKDGF
jgi:hypothetical protein